LGNEVLLGEYWSNAQREAVNIYAIEVATQQRRILYRFPAGAVRHVHTVSRERYADGLWISTGDEDAECMIARLDPRTSQLEVVGQGSQKWRTASLAFRPDAVYWGTDSPEGENQVWRFDRETGETRAVGSVRGPVYYNVCLDNHVVFGTTQELGEGQQDGFGRLYALADDNRLVEVWRQKKDLWHPRLFGYGVFEFAEGYLAGNRFWVTAKGFRSGLSSALFHLKDD
jgi:hypothetical protein